MDEAPPAEVCAGLAGGPPAEVVAQLRSAGAAVVMTASSGSAAGLRAALPADVRPLVLDGGRVLPLKA